MSSKGPALTGRLHNLINRGYRRFTASSRVMPSYLIIGASKCGTTSLYNYLIQHPAIFPASTKEVHFFDYYFHRGLSWYKSHFPTLSEVARCSAQNSQPCITGESSPYYLAHPLSPQRVKQLLPEARLICMLRNPVDRALSSYYNQVRLGIEKLPSFEEALKVEESRIAGQEERLRNDPSYSGFEHKYFSYFRRGCYVDQLENWFRHFDRDRIMVIQSETFFSQPEKVFSNVLGHIGVQPWTPPEFSVFNAGGEYTGITPRLREDLLERYRPYNERLFSLLGERYEGWDR